MNSLYVEMHIAAAAAVDGGGVGVVVITFTAGAFALDAH